MQKFCTIDTFESMQAAQATALHYQEEFHLDEAELCMIQNIQASEAQEAFVLIPTLREKISAEDLDRLIADLRQHQPQ